MPKNKEKMITVAEATLKRHSVVFSKTLGTMKGIKARLTIKPKIVPKFCQPRNIPYAL